MPGAVGLLPSASHCGSVVVDAPPPQSAAAVGGNKMSPAADCQDEGGRGQHAQGGQSAEQVRQPPNRSALQPSTLHVRSLENFTVGRPVDATPAGIVHDGIGSTTDAKRLPNSPGNWGNRQ
jgi:hypothetical protein